MTKEEYIELAEKMGFRLDYDQWEEKGYMRMQLPDNIDEKELRWIVYKDDSVITNITRSSKILFKAGQKQKILQLNGYISLTQ